MPKPNRLTEADVNKVVLRILADTAMGEASVRYIKKRFPDYVKLSPADHALSGARPGEETWEQQVRNLRSNKKIEANIFAEGYAVSVRRGAWRITDTGRRRAKRP